VILKTIRVLFACGMDRILISLRIGGRMAKRQLGPEQGGALRCFGQGEDSVPICGLAFSVHPTSQLKSNTYINAA
jgi:hypothetical protein